MEGTTFKERLTALAGKEGADGENARAVQKLIAGFAADIRGSINGTGDVPTAVQAIKDRAQDRLKELDGTLADGRELLEAYGKTQKKRTFEVWLKDKHSADDALKPKIDRLLSFLDALEPESIREEILNSGDAAKFEAAIAETKSGIQAALDKLDAVEAALKQEMPSEPDKTLPDFLEYLAEQEGSGNAEAETIRQILSRSAIKAEVVAGTAKLSDILSAIDQDTAQTHSSQERAQLKTATTRLRDCYRAETPTAANGRTVASKGKRIFDRVLSKTQNLSILLIIGVAGYVILYGLTGEGVLALFADNSTARGFITLIFAVGTITIFMTITAAIVFDVNSSSKDIYERAKTILSMLLGVFGTVLGFYFGLSEDKKAGEEFAVREIEFVEANSGELDFKTSVSGGTAPYDFIIRVTGPEGDLISNLSTPVRSSSGALTLDKPLDVTEHTGKTVTVSVTALDSKARTASPTSESRKIAAPEVNTTKPAE